LLLADSVPLNQTNSGKAPNYVPEITTA